MDLTAANSVIENALDGPAAEHGQDCKDNCIRRVDNDKEKEEKDDDVKSNKYNNSSSSSSSNNNNSNNNSSSSITIVN